MRIIQVSDLHFGGEDRGALAAVERFVADSPPDLVVATGDLASVGQRRELEDAFAWLRGLPAPVLATSGNHDVPYYSLLGRVIDPFRRFRQSATGVTTQPWRGDGCVVVAVNTARGVQWRANWAQGAISRRQTDWAARQFESAGGAKLRILATHHPLDWPNDAPIAGRTWGGREAQRRLAHAGVDVFLSGHLHVASARAVEGGAVAVCTLSRRLRHDPCGFTVVECAGEELSVSLMHVVNRTIETATVRTFPLS